MCSNGHAAIQSQIYQYLQSLTLKGMPVVQYTLQGITAHFPQSPSPQAHALSLHSYALASRDDK